MIFHFSIVKTILFFCYFNFIILFPFLLKYYNIVFIFIEFSLGHWDFFFVSLLISILTPLFLPSLSVSLSYFIFTVPKGGGWMIFFFFF